MIDLPPDFAELLKKLVSSHCDFIIVGAYAVGANGCPRATGDLDVLVNPVAWNATRVFSALRAFGAPIRAHGLTEADFATPGTVYQMGLPPFRIDILTRIEAVSYAEASGSRLWGEMAGMALPFLGYEMLLKNKRSVGRPKDLIDVGMLESKRRR